MTAGEPREPKVKAGVSRDETKIDLVTDRLHCLGVDAARQNIAWWTRRLEVYTRCGEEVNHYLVEAARAQIAVQQEWLDANTTTVQP